MTAPHDFVGAGHVVAMRARDKHGPRVVEVPGLEAWREVGGAGVRWYPDSRGCVGIDSAMPDEGNRVTIPATPWCQGAIGISDERGEVMVCAVLLPGSTQVNALPAPKQMTVSVRGAGGRAVANATVSYRLELLARSRFRAGQLTMPSPTLRVVGATSEAGELRFHAPEQVVVKDRFGDRQQHLLVFVDAEGFSQGTGLLGAETSTEVHIHKSDPVQVRVKGEGAEVASFASVGPFSVRPSRSSHMFGRRTLVTTHKSDDNWQVHGLRGGFKPCVRMAARRPTAVLTAYVESPTPPVVVDLDAMPRVVVAVTAADGAPAPATLIVGRPEHGHPPRTEATIATDLSGRACLHLGEGAYYVYAIAGQTHALAMIDENTVGPVRLRLEPVETMTVRVVDEGGQAVEGARVKGYKTSVSGVQDGKDLDSQWIRQSIMMVWHFLRLVRSESDGSVEVPVFLRGPVRAEGTVWLGDRSSEPFALRAGTSCDVVLK